MIPIEKETSEEKQEEVIDDFTNLSPREKFLLSQKNKSKSPKNEKKKSPKKV